MEGHNLVMRPPKPDTRGIYYKTFCINGDWGFPISIEQQPPQNTRATQDLKKKFQCMIQQPCLALNLKRQRQKKQKLKEINESFTPNPTSKSQDPPSKSKALIFNISLYTFFSQFFFLCLKLRCQPPWILKRGGPEGSGQRLIFLNCRTKIIAYFCCILIKEKHRKNCEQLP